MTCCEPLWIQLDSDFLLDLVNFALVFGGGIVSNFDHVGFWSNAERQSISLVVCTVELTALPIWLSTCDPGFLGGSLENTLTRFGRFSSLRSRCLVM